MDRETEDLIAEARKMAKRAGYEGLNEIADRLVDYGEQLKDICEIVGRDILNASRSVPEAVARLRSELSAKGAEPIATDDDVERLARKCGWDNRKYMTPADYAIWAERMREFVRLAAPPAPARGAEPVDYAATYQRMCDLEREVGALKDARDAMALTVTDDMAQAGKDWYENESEGDCLLRASDVTGIFKAMIAVAPPASSQQARDAVVVALREACVKGAAEMNVTGAVLKYADAYAQANADAVMQSIQAAMAKETKP